MIIYQSKSNCYSQVLCDNINLNYINLTFENELKGLSYPIDTFIRNTSNLELIQY